MPLLAGARLGPYEILDLIGAGGMGEVYRARDPRLNRTVAVKLLPSNVHADPDKRARFEREGRALAGLSHPHICTVYDVGTVPPGDGVVATSYLVMEHLPGETLAARLERGPLPVGVALEIGIQIADGLAAAHRHGIIHRDLKPANVMLAAVRSGVPSVKLLDFGVAKLRPVPQAGLPDEAPPTASLTGEGAVLGTVPYMAPEQVEGKETDARTDLWALGVILYEMLTGRRPFEGESTVSLVSRILQAEPPELTADTPPGLQRLVYKCLEKAPDDRWDTAHDVADELRWISQTGLVSPAQSASPSLKTRRWLYRAVVPLAISLAGFAIGSRWLWSDRPRHTVAHVRLDLLPADELSAGGIALPYTAGGSRTALRWTPDGRALVFVGRREGTQQIYVRRMDADEAVPLAGTQGAQIPTVSPDGESVTFWADGEIRQVPLRGGPIQVLSSAVPAVPLGMTRLTDGRIFFSDAEHRIIREVTTDGVVPVIATRDQDDDSQSLPAALPDGRTLLLTVRRRSWSWGDEDIVALDVESSTRKVLLRNAADARYVPTGHLVFLRQARLFAVPFDLDRLEIVGPEVPLIDGVAQALTAENNGDVTGAGQFDVSSNGTLAWIPSPVMPYADGSLVTIDRHGSVTSLGAPERSYAPPIRLSPDGGLVAVIIRDVTEWSLWSFDIQRRTLTPLIRKGEADWPAWWPGGQRLAFSHFAEGNYYLAAQHTNRADPPTLVLPTMGKPSTFTPDGNRLALISAVSGADIMIATIQSDGTATVEPWLQTSDTELWPEISPNGRWLAYGSDAAGRNEVYLRSFPQPGPAIQVSVDGGGDPAWHPDGGELFFVSPPDADGGRRMMVVDVDVSSPSEPQVGAPRPLFSLPTGIAIHCVPLRCFNVGPRGEQFYAVQYAAPRSPPVVTQINLVQNWFEEVRDNVPTDTH